MKVVKKRKVSKRSVREPYIVAIGASAGGLEAITELFDHVPPETGFVFILIQHLSPDYKSLMPELLGRHTKMPIYEARHGMSVSPDSIYLLPSRKVMTMSGGKLVVHEKTPGKQPNNAIDVFFTSLAADAKERAVGVILSGTGTDGTKGLEAIRKNGGINVVQDPMTAAFDGMPGNAIQAGCADLILPPEVLMMELMEFINDSASVRKIQMNNTRDELVLRDILVVIRRETGHDFSHYKRPTLLRRLAKRMMELGLQRLQDYLAMINTNSAEARMISQEFLINVTYFFRDKAAFDALQHSIIPAIFKEKVQGDTLKVWSVGCSSGEEAYSIAILIHEHIHRKKLLDINVKIFATDVDRDALERASRGVYSAASMADVPAPRKSRYFIEENGTFRITPEIRKMIVFSYHDILKDPPFSRMDLISCRNMLIYIGSDAQKEIIRKIHFALNLDGYLFLGPSEHLGQASAFMKEVDKKWKIYMNTSKARMNDEGVFSPLERSYMHALKQKVKNPVNFVSDIFRETLLEDYEFAGIFLDVNFEVKEATGHYKRFLSLPDAGFNFNIMKLVPTDLGIALNIALRKAMKEQHSISMKHVNVEYPGGPRKVSITVKPYLKQKEYQHPFIFVVLSEMQPAANSKVVKLSQSENSVRVNELEEELRETKENLQAVIEEVEAANEELQSTNEEIVSTNEELQSTNEELQSLNEELHTVSAEHQLKIKELLDLNDDLNNYFRNSTVGQLFVDSKLIIRKFSPAVTKMINLIDSDINRSLLDINTRIGRADFLSDIRQVMSTGKPIEREVMQEGETFLIRTTPYLRHEQKSDGVVVTFIDISETKRLSSLLSAILDSSPSSIIALEANRNRSNKITGFTVKSANAAYSAMVGIPQEQLIGSVASEHGDGREHEDLFVKVMQSGDPLHFEYFSESRQRWYDSVVVKLGDGVVQINTDITEKKKAADVIAQSYADLKVTSRKLKRTNRKLEQSNMDLLQFASVASHDLKEPMRKIQTFGNLLMQHAKDKLDAQDESYLQKMISASARMQRLIEDVLTLSKLSNKGTATEEVDLNDVIRLIKEDLDLQIRERKATINARNLPVVRGNAGQFHQVFQNLIGNALKFTNGRAPQISIKVRPVKRAHAEKFKLREDKYMSINVKDNGIGFEQTYEEKIFGIFQRLNGASYDGTGIGLAICRKIVENHSGFITAEGRPGLGAEFFIILPRHNFVN